MRKYFFDVTWILMKMISRKIELLIFRFSKLLLERYAFVILSLYWFNFNLIIWVIHIFDNTIIKYDSWNGGKLVMIGRKIRALQKKYDLSFKRFCLKRKTRENYFFDFSLKNWTNKSTLIWEKFAHLKLSITQFNFPAYKRKWQWNWSHK